MRWHDIEREWIRTTRDRVGVMMPTLFYFIILMMFMFIDTPDTAFWALLLPRIILVPVFLAMLLIPGQCFQADHQSGYLQHYLVSPVSLMQRVCLRLGTLAVIYMTPLAVLMLGFAVLMGFDADLMMAMGLCVLLATPTLFVMAAFAGALTLALPQATLLQAVVLMPLYIPVLLFAQGLIMRAQLGLPYMAFVYLLLGLMLLTFSALPLLTSILLRWAYE